MLCDGCYWVHIQVFKSEVLLVLRDGCYWVHIQVFKREALLVLLVVVTGYSSIQEGGSDCVVWWLLLGIQVFLSEVLIVLCDGCYWVFKYSRVSFCWCCVVVVTEYSRIQE